MSSTGNPLRVLVTGGTGAQGRYIIPELVKDGKYHVTVLTQNVNSASAKSLEALGNVSLLSGSYTVEADLRKALKHQYAVFVNPDSFTMTEAEELFWTFRMYEISVQSGVKHFIYSAVASWQKLKFNYAEDHRASHQITMGRIQDWLSVQPVSILPWTTIIGTFYSEMLSGALRPEVSQDGTYIFRSATGSGSIQFVDLPQYGRFTRWVLDNPSRSIGQEISLGIYTATLEEIAQSFQRVTGNKAVAKLLSQDEWFKVEKERGLAVDAKLPFNQADDTTDDSRFTYRQLFGGFWNVWKGVVPDDVKVLPGRELHDEIYPDRIKSIEEWMRVTGYTGEPKQVLKWHAR